MSKEILCKVVDQLDTNLTAEGTAMLAALASRSLGTVEEKLARVAKNGPEKFIQQFVVGYGHDSILKCGTTSIFLSNVSMLCAKALQQGPLYAGQESSTRYIPFSAQDVHIPEALNQSVAQKLVDRTMDLYVRAKPMLVDHLLATVEKQEGVTDAKWLKTLEARAFDIARCLLPAGCKTVVVWNTPLSNVSKELLEMHGHELEEVRECARLIQNTLNERYPSSFSRTEDISAEKIEWAYRSNLITNALRPDIFGGANDVIMNAELFSNRASALVETMISKRGKYQPLPDALGELGRISFDFALDFGGIRDMARHTKGNRSWSLLTPSIGMHPWYLSQMPEALVTEVYSLLREVDLVHDVLCNTDASLADLQYIMPMGYQCNMTVSYPLDNAVYVSELRSGPTVHPTVRKVAQTMGSKLQAFFPGLPMFHNTSVIDTLDVRRADQDIVETPYVVGIDKAVPGADVSVETPSGRIDVKVLEGDDEEIVTVTRNGSSCKENAADEL